MALATYNYILLTDGYSINCNNKNQATEAIIPSEYNGLPVTRIASGAFSGCRSLTRVTIPNSITSIGSYAFQGYNRLTSIEIPNSVMSIEKGAFQDCTALTSITIPNSITSIEQSVFSDCIGLTSITIPNSVTSIGSTAFSNCRSLTSVTIGNSVTSIGESAFYYCSSLTSIRIIAITPPTLGVNALSLTNDCPIYVREQSVNTYKNATNWNTYASRIQAMLKKLIDLEALKVYDGKIKEYANNRVKANPAGTGTTDLSKLEVNGTVYNIPSGGGGGALYSHQITIGGANDYTVITKLYSTSNTPLTLTALRSTYFNAFKYNVILLDPYASSGGTVAIVEFVDDGGTYLDFNCCTNGWNLLYLTSPFTFSDIVTEL